MANWFYEAVIPDYTDMENGTGDRPGYEVGICEQDGGVGITMVRRDEHGKEDFRGVFMNPDEARVLLDGLQAAINRASSKVEGGGGHPNRVKVSYAERP